MNGVHDMGGMDGFGPVVPEVNEPVFHETWEGRVLAMNRAMGYTRTWNGDISRYAKEALPPEVYLGSSYYRRWAIGLEWMLMENGLVGADEFAAGKSLRPGEPLKRKLTTERLETALARGSYDRPANAQHSSSRPHAFAAVCAWPCRRDRARPWLPRFPRQPCFVQPRRRSTVALYGAFRQP